MNTLADRHSPLNRSLYGEVLTNAAQRLATWLNPKRFRLYLLATAAMMWTLATVLLSSWLLNLLGGSGLLDASSHVIGSDFRAFYTGGNFLLTDRLGDLYDLSLQKSFQDSVLLPLETDSVSAFLNPPFATLIYAPFAAGGYLAGLFAWWAVSLVLLILSLWLLRRELANVQSSSLGLPLWRWVLLSMLFYPTILWILSGQITSLTLLIYVATFALLRKKKDFAAGLVWGMLLYKPQLAFVLALVLLVKWRWRALAGGLISVVAWLSTGFVIGWSPTMEFIELGPWMLEFLRSDGYNTWNVHSFYGFAALLLDGIFPRGADILAWTLSLGATGAFVWIWHRFDWAPGTRRWDMTMAATFAAGLLISPHLFTYDLMLLLLPLAIVWCYYADGRPNVILDGGKLLVATFLLCMAVCVSSYFSTFQITVSSWLELPKIAIQISVPCLVLWIYVVIKQTGLPISLGHRKESNLTDYGVRDIRMLK